jgi:hypothetical protein
MPVMRSSPLKPLLLHLLLQEPAWHLLHCPCLLLCACPAAVLSEDAPGELQAWRRYVGYLQAPKGLPLHQLQLLQRAEWSVGKRVPHRAQHSASKKDSAYHVHS